MSSPNIPDFDSLWDYAHPDQTEEKFREILFQISEEDPSYLELLTQIARAQGLQRKFDRAHQTLDQVEKRLSDYPSRAKVRWSCSAISGSIASSRSATVRSRR